MYFHPRLLSILTTRRCTAACDHCCIGSSPTQTQAIPVARIHGLIDEATRIPTIEKIVFTGGECFLLGRALDELVAHATAQALGTRVITNGYWAVDDRSARRRVETLAAAGLGEMMISTGTFHQRFVPVTRVASAARAAADAGLLVRLAIEVCDQSTFDEGTLLDELAEPIAAGSVVVGHDPWTTDVGQRGQAVLSHEYLLDAEPERAHGRCDLLFNVVSVTPAQELMACCGFPQEQLPLMQLGSVAERALDDVLDEAPPELLKMWIHTDGPAAIGAFVAKYVPGFELPRVASICELCAGLQRSEVAMRVLGEHAGEVASHVASRFARLHGARA
jgi:pyruvate-formate lyase-activating enzyme